MLYEVITPSVSWGINPGQNIGVDERLPRLDAEHLDDDGPRFTDAMNA